MSSVRGRDAVIVKGRNCDREVRSAFCRQVTTLGKLFTHMCLYHQAVGLQFGIRLNAADV